MDFEIKKYPRTPHLTGSRLQPGDEDLSQIPFSLLSGRHLVIEEKIDGANSAVSFDRAGRLLLQSRGHYLTGGYRERHYDLLKLWANVQKDVFYRTLGSRYIMYGEWMYVKHRVYYDALPSYFMEFDIYDRETDRFLDTPSRKTLTAQMPVCSVPVLAKGTFQSAEEILACLGPSRYIRESHVVRLRDYCAKNGLDADIICAETDLSAQMEGLYIKTEEDGSVTGRVKFVRASFAQITEQSATPWLDRQIIPNGLCVPVEDMFR